MADRDDFGSFVMGFLVGAVAGGIAALLMAPQSGEETRAIIRDKSIELRDKAQMSAEEAMQRAQQAADDARAWAMQASDSVRSKAAAKASDVAEAVAPSSPKATKSSSTSS
jgi:gas vesicle protein